MFVYAIKLSLLTNIFAKGSGLGDIDVSRTLLKEVGRATGAR